MSKPIFDKISDYTRSQSRNKIVIHRERIADIEPVNIGQSLSEAIFNFKETGKLPMRVSIELDNILHTSISQHDLFGKCLSIANLGILFEPELKIDFSRLLDKYSQNNVLFVQWDGEINSGILFFLSREHGVKINIRNLSHIVI